jgi:hypothetical protein
MNITKEFCKRQLRRLSAVPLYMPTDPEAVEVWIEAMTSYCRDQDHLSETMNTFLFETIRCDNPVAAFVAIARTPKSIYKTV